MDNTYTAQLIVEADLHGVRIDSFLVRHFRNYTTWRMQRLAVSGQVWVNDAIASPTQRVFAGETVRIRLTEPPDKLVPPEPVAFRVVYQDAWLMVVEKPAGIVAHPTGDFQSGTMANGLQAYLDAIAPVRGLLRPGLPHRLDRQTSGLMVIATHHQAHSELSVAFESGRVSKAYLAVVDGVVKPHEGTIDLPIGRHRADRRVLMSARADAINPRPSKTRFQVEEQFERHTLVRAKPLTGRNHQIRVHLAHVGHPLVGDEFYDRFGVVKPWRTDHSVDAESDVDQAPTQMRSNNMAPEEILAPGRHALHAASLSFAHPISGAWMSFWSPLPGDLRRLIESLREDLPQGPPVAKARKSE